MPLALRPELHPGVVVVAVGPPGGVHLPGGDAHRAQGADQQGGLLPAAAEGPVEYAEGGDGAVISGPIGGLPGAPVVDLQGGGEHILALYQGGQLFIEEPPAAVGKLIVHPGREHIADEQLLGHLGGIGQLPPGPLGGPGIAQQQLRRKADQVPAVQSGVQRP